MVQYIYTIATQDPRADLLAVATFHRLAREALIIILGTRVLILVSRAVLVHCSSKF